MNRAFLPASLLSLGAVFAFPTAGRAQPVTGIYLGAGAGGNFMQPSKSEFVFKYQPGLIPNSAFRDKVDHDPGFAGVASAGYGFGNGFRVELEGDYRRNNGSFSSKQEKYGAMANGLFDFDIGSPYVFPYAGVGAGYMRVENGQFGYRANAFAYQGIAGLSFPVPGVVGLSATLEYRFLGLAESREKRSAGTVGGYPVCGPVAGCFPAYSETEKDYNNLNHSLLLGVRYAFNVPGPAAPEAATPAAMPAPQPARSYIVFFDWDRADLTARARQIVAEAAQNIGHVQHTKIEVDGNADKSGTSAYNLGLSRRRAEAVAAELVRDGVKRSDIAIQAFGDTHPLVATAAGVREPQNRRVEIVIR